MHVQIGRGAGEILIQQSVSAHACKEEAELCAEEGPDSPNYTVEIGEGLGTTPFMAHGLCSSSPPSSNSPSSVWKELSLRCGWVYSPLTWMVPNSAKPRGQELGPRRDTNPMASSAQENVFARRIMDKSGLEVSSDLCFPEKMQLSFCCLARDFSHFRCHWAVTPGTDTLCVTACEQEYPMTWDLYYKPWQHRSCQHYHIQLFIPYTLYSYKS